ncbi:MAG: NUDIX domain-containing protein [Methanobacteriota archaeon]
MAASQSGPRITVGVGAFLVRDERLLVVRKTYGPWRGRWAIPSGYVEPHESVVETLEREVLEETRIRGRPEALVAVRHMVGPEANDTFLVFTMRYVSGEPRPDGREVSEAGFVPIEELVSSEDAAPFTKAVLSSVPAAGLRLDDYRPPEGAPPARSYLLYTSPAKVH